MKDVYYPKFRKMWARADGGEIVLNRLWRVLQFLPKSQNTMPHFELMKTWKKLRFYDNLACRNAEILQGNPSHR